MILGFKNPNNYHFGNRIKELYNEMKIDINCSAWENKVAKNLFENKIVLYNSDDIDAQRKQIINTGRRLKEHLKVESAENISGQWLMIYCKFFKCSCDYLMGYIGHPTKAKTDIYELTGLESNTVDTLAYCHNCKTNNSFPEYNDNIIMLLNFLLYCDKSNLQNEKYPYMAASTNVNNYEKIELLQNMFRFLSSDGLSYCNGSSHISIENDKGLTILDDIPVKDLDNTLLITINGNMQKLKKEAQKWFLTIAPDFDTLINQILEERDKISNYENIINSTLSSYRNNIQTAYTTDIMHTLKLFSGCIQMSEEKIHKIDNIIVFNHYEKLFKGNFHQQDNAKEQAELNRICNEYEVALQYYKKGSD